MARFWRRRVGVIARLAAGAAVILFVAGCATGPKYGPDSPVTTIVVPVERLAYAPLLPKLPVTVAIYYAPEFREAVVSSGGGDSPRYRYEIGTAAVALFDQTAAALFARTMALPSLPDPSGTVAGVDLILVPRFEANSMSFSFATDVLARDGSSIAHVTNANSYAIQYFRSDEVSTAFRAQSLHIANRLVTGVVADLSIALVLSLDITQWAEAHGATWTWVDALPPARSAMPTGVAIVSCFDRSFNCAETAHTVAVGEALRNLDRTIKIIQPDELRRAFYPWMWSHVYITDAQVAEWLRRPAVAARAKVAGVRYLVVADKLDAWTREHGDIGVLASSIGGGFFGFMWWTQNESARLQVFDFATATDVGNVSHQREDVTLAMPAFVIPLPIPIPRSGDSMPDVIAKQLLPLVKPSR